MDEDFDSNLVTAKHQSFNCSTSAPPPSPNLESSQTSGQELLSGYSQPPLIEQVLSSKSLPSLSSSSLGHLSPIKPETSSWSSQVSPNAPESSPIKPEVSPESIQVFPFEQDSGSPETYTKQEESPSGSTSISYHTS